MPCMPMNSLDTEASCSVVYQQYVNVSEAWLTNKTTTTYTSQTHAELFVSISYMNMNMYMNRDTGLT